MRFIDRAANQILVAEHFKDYNNSTAEFFYWSPDCVKLLIKQGHVIKKYLSANPLMQHHWQSTNITFQTVRLIHERVLRSLLYTTWDDSWYQADKATSDWYSEFDSWFTEGYKDTTAVGVWREGVDYVNTKLSNYVNDNGDGLKHYAKYYNLGPVTGLVSQYPK
jgi:hypothetical protein